MGRKLYGSGQDGPADAPRGERLERVAAWLATVGAATLLAFVIAHWFWRVVAPAPAATPPPALADGSAALLAAAPLFGGAASRRGGRSRRAAQRSERRRATSGSSA